MNIYLAGPIFTERDRMFNSYLEKRILEKHPEVDLYLAQNNAGINDKTGCANSADIYAGDVKRLKESDLVITIMSGDMPPIGSSYECAYYASICENDYSKKIIALYDDSREGMHTYSDAKRNAMISGIAENQWPYINLLAIGFVKKVGEIFFTSEEFLDAIDKHITLFEDERLSGIYKITNLKNNLVYIGQSINLYNQIRSYKQSFKHDSNELYDDMKKLGMEYFKFDILEKCAPEELDSREKYWIKEYDAYNNGYNKTFGGSSNKKDIETNQTIRVYSYNLDGSFCKEYISIGSALRDLNLKSNDITRCIGMNDNKHISGNHMWRLYKVDKIEPYEKQIGGKRIYSYDPLTREFIHDYDNVQIAATELCGHRNVHISACAIGKRKTSCGLMWAYDYFPVLPNDYYENLDEKEIMNENDDL